MPQTKTNNSANAPQIKKDYKYLQTKRLKQIITNANCSVDNKLAEVYSDHNGEIPDLSRLDKTRPHFWRNLIIITTIILASLTALAWLGFFIFSRQSGLPTKGVAITIEAPKEVASGEQISYVINYKNLEKVPLNKLELIVRYPEGFIFESSEPLVSNETNALWELPGLGTKESGTVKITGRLVGDLDAQKDLTVIVSYWPKNFNSEFQTDEIWTTKISSSIIQLTIEGPSQLLEDKEVEYLVKYKNTSQEDLRDIRFTIIYPEKFTLQSATPQPEERDSELRHLGDVWLVKELASDEEQKITVKGEQILSRNKELLFKVQAELPSEDGEYYLQQEKVFTTRVMKDDIALNLIVNGQTANSSIGLGDTLNYSIVCQNKSDVEFADLTLHLKLNAFPQKLLDWTSLKDLQNGEVIDEQEIVWTKKEISALKTLGAGGEITIDLQINTNGGLELDPNDLRIDGYLNLEIGQLGEEEVDIEIASDLLSTKINSNLQLIAAARYFNDDNIAVGTGPLPPKVGETTNYRIYWRLINTLHELTDVTIQAVLPSDVNWTGKNNFNQGSFSYDSSTRLVNWTINRLPTELSEVEADFEISFTPDNSHANKIIILIPETIVNAHDKETNGQISQTAGAITTDLVNDPMAKGRGLVEG